MTPVAECARAAGAGRLSRALARTATLLALIRFSHTLFALPWGLAGLFLGSGGWPEARVLVLVVAAMAGARTAAMAFNRLADRRYDATNPRTASRASVTGEVSPAAMTALLLAGLAVFIASSHLLNPLCGLLSYPVAALLLGYSLTKRFSSISHFVLGVCLGLAPVGACLAARGAFDAVTGASALLGLAVMLWTAGFDILYACQDVEHDRRETLFSVPARFGVPAAFAAARISHGLVPVALAGAAVAAGLGWVFIAGIAVVAILLLVEHRLVAPGDLARLNLAFFQVNVAIALVVMSATLADLLAGPAA